MKYSRKYLKKRKIFEPKVFYDISQSAAPSKHHKIYGKSFKKFVGGGVVVVVACLIIVSLQVLETDLELDNFNTNRMFRNIQLSATTLVIFKLPL